MWMLERMSTRAVGAWHCMQLSPRGTRKDAMEVRGQPTSLLMDEPQTAGPLKQLI